MKLRYILLPALALLMAAALWALRGLSDFELAGRSATDVSFTSQGNSLSGTLVMPGEADAPVVLLVHGDGAQNRWSQDGYLPLVNALLDRGIGVYSWDKPGVNASTGNWLAQTMEDRATEAADAMRALRASGLVTGRIGFLGFSQAGWVVPEAGETAQADFEILIGPAISWRAQGVHYARNLFEAQGYGPEEALRMAEDELAGDDSAARARGPTTCAPAYCTREDFLRRNRDADATWSIGQITRPVMVLGGAEDLNVDTAETVAVYQAELDPDLPAHIARVPDATHSLLRARWFNHLTPDDWPPTAQVLFATMGRRAYVPGVIDSVAGWVFETTDTP